MSIQRYTRSFILLFSLLSAIVLLSPPTTATAASNVSAADSTATATESNDMTVGEAFSHDEVLRESVFRAFNVNSNSPLSTVTQQLTNNDGTQLHITKPIKDFRDFKYLKGTFNELYITNQTDLSGQNFNYLLRLLEVDPELQNYIYELDLSNDQLTNTDFDKLCATIAKQPITIWDNLIFNSLHPLNELNVMHNKISDFSALNSIFNFQSIKTDSSSGIGDFWGWGQNTEPKILPRANVIDNTIDLPVKQWSIYKLAQADKNRDSTDKFQTDTPLGTTFFYRVYKNDADGTETDGPFWGTTKIDRTRLKYNYGLDNLTIDPENFTVTNADRVNSIDYEQNNYQNIANSGDLNTFQAQLDSVHAKYLDGKKLSGETKLFNIPSGTSSVEIRALFLQDGESSFSAGYTENYKIPLNWANSSISTQPATNSTATSNDSSPSHSPSTTTLKGTVVYATKKIALYGDTNFSTKTRQQWYPKQPRIYRPMFKVTGYAQSTQGRARYLVKDVNHQSKTYGDTGYITTKLDYVVPVYYHQATKQVTAINPKGVNAYRQKNLTGKVAHYRQGQTLRVKRLVKHNLTTRYVLTNGHYITANKKLVQTSHVTVPKRVKAKTAINRYRDVNFRHRQQHYRKGSTLKITGWDYSQHGTKRYRVAHGYITANQRYIKTIQ